MRAHESDIKLGALIIMNRTSVQKMWHIIECNFNLKNCIDISFLFIGS